MHEHSSLLTSVTNQTKIHFADNCISTLIISCSSNISYSLTCPKTWGKEPRRLNTLKMINFHSFEQPSLPTLLMKQNRNNPANICWSWRRLQRNNFSSSNVLKTFSRHVLKTSWRRVLKTLWRQAKYLLGISVPNKSKCVSNKSILSKSTFDNSKANPKCIK